MKKVKLDFDKQLHSVPVRNSKVKLTYPEHNPDVLLAEVELKYKGLIAIAAKIFGSRKRKGYELEGVAREIYENLDGEKTVENLVLNFAKDEKLGFLESRALIVQYLKNLMEKGLVVIVASDEI